MLHRHRAMSECTCSWLGSRAAACSRCGKARSGRRIATSTDPRLAAIGAASGVRCRPRRNSAAASAKWPWVAPGFPKVVVQVGVGGGVLQRVGIAGGGFVEVAASAGDEAEVVMHVRVVAAGRPGVAEMRLRRGMVALREGGASALHGRFDVDIHGAVLPVSHRTVQQGVGRVWNPLAPVDYENGQAQETIGVAARRLPTRIKATVSLVRRPAGSRTAGRSRSGQRPPGPSPAPSSGSPSLFRRRRSRLTHLGRGLVAYARRFCGRPGLCRQVIFPAPPSRCAARVAGHGEVKDGPLKMPYYQKISLN